MHRGLDQDQYPNEFSFEVKAILDRHPDITELGFDVATLDRDDCRVVRRYIWVNGKKMGLGHSKMPAAGNELINLINREATNPPEWATGRRDHPYWLASIGGYQHGLRFSRQGVGFVDLVEAKVGREPFDNRRDYDL